MASIKKNLIYNVSYQVLIYLIPLITSPYLARTLGANSIGIYSYTYSIAYYFMIFTNLGINYYGNRSIAAISDDKEEISKVFCSIYTLQLIFSIIVIITYIIYCVFWCSKYVMTSCIQGIYVLTYALDITWYFYGKENFKLIVSRNTIIKIINFILILAFIKHPNDVWKYTLIMSGCSLIGQLVTWPYVLKEVTIQLPSYDSLKKHIKPIFVLFIPVLAISVFTYMDKVMLGEMSSMRETGYYENSDKIISIPKSMIQAIGAVMLPRTANMLAHGEEKAVYNTIKITILCVLIISIGCAFGLSAISNNFSVIFWGEGFQECGILITTLTPALVLSVFGNVIRTQYLIPKCMDKEYTISLIIGAIVNFICNYFCIQLYGAIGACIGTVVAEFALCFYQTWAVRKQLEIKEYIKMGVPPLICGALMYMVILLVKSIVQVSIISLIIEIIIGGVIYCGLYLIYLKFTSDEFARTFIFSILKKIKSKIIKNI